MRKATLKNNNLAGACAQLKKQALFWFSNRNDGGEEQKIVRVFYVYVKERKKTTVQAEQLRERKEGN